MSSFNKVILVGNLTRDPQVRFTPGGTAVAELGLAVNRYWFDKATNAKKEETTFVDVTLWGRDAEVAGEYLTKGRPVLIEGRLHLDTWDDKQTGQKIWEYQLPAGGFATPITYEVDGKQYIAIACGGARGKKAGGWYLAFALP